jgi:hypothetical protein
VREAAPAGRAGRPELADRDVVRGLGGCPDLEAGRRGVGRLGSVVTERVYVPYRALLSVQERDKGLSQCDRPLS